MGKKRFLIIDTEILPDVYEKVLFAKELIRLGKAKGVTEAVEMTGISRSTFYKYKDFIFSTSEHAAGQKVTISILLSHTPGILSNILNHLANCKANILTIHQDIPINNAANISLTFDIANVDIGMDELLSSLKSNSGVLRAELIAME